MKPSPLKSGTLKSGTLKPAALKTGTLADINRQKKDEAPVKLKRPNVELTDEIKALRLRNKQFAATNSHETYLIVVFSTKEDKNAFAGQIGQSPEPGLTILDGYEVAKALNLQPQKPKFKLNKPLK